jgi:hypothetical protein
MVNGANADKISAKLLGGVSLVALVLLALALATSAQAAISRVTVVAGPSPSIVGMGNVAMAPDGTGGVAWRQIFDGEPHVFVSRFTGGRWSAPILANPGQTEPATFPAIAAGDHGELLVVWVQPYASLSTGGQTPTTYYQLLSSVMEPGAQSFGPPEQVDPNNVGDGAGVDPSLAMAADGVAFVAYRVVTNQLSPDVTQPPGTIAPMKPGDELIDVRVARFNGLTWTSLGTVNAFPGEVTMRPPTPNNAPVIGINDPGQGMVVWQEPTIDAVARIWARRIFGTTLGNAEEVSPQKVKGKPVTADADAPALSFGLDADAEVAFRLQGGSGSPLKEPYEFINSIGSSTDAQNGSTFSGPEPLGGAGSVGIPSVAISPFGDFEAAYTAGSKSSMVTGTGNSANGPAESLGAASAGTNAFADLDPGGGGAVVWQGTTAGQPTVDVREAYPAGGFQNASLSAPISGPISGLTSGLSGQGDAVIGFEQGLGSTTQVAVADVEAPAHTFQILGPTGWVTPATAELHWGYAATGIGGVRYSIVLDGTTIASGLTSHRYLLPPEDLGSGKFHVEVVATNSAGQETVTPTHPLEVDATAPLVSAHGLGKRRVRVTIRDPFSGARPHGTSISFGDRTRPLRNALVATHRYRRRGVYRLTIRCASNAGTHASDHLLVRVS